MASPERKIAAVQPSERTSGANEVSGTAGIEDENTEAEQTTANTGTTEATSKSATTAAADAQSNGNVRLLQFWHCLTLF